MQKLTDLSQAIQDAVRAGDVKETDAGLVFTKPIAPRNEMWRIWHIKYIYTTKENMQPTTPDGVGCWIPKVGDLLFDPTQGWRLVTVVDIQGDLHTEHIPWNPKQTEGGEEDGDHVVLGGGVSHLTSEHLICSVDYSQIPAVMMADNRIQAFGSNIGTAKIFLHNDIGEHGKVISCRFDNSGNIISENLELEVVYEPGKNIKNIWIPKACNVSERVEDGETGTLVFYDKEGGYVPPAYRLVFQHSAFVRRLEGAKRYIKRVELLTPFKSENDPNIIEIPVDVNSLESVEWRGRVWYTDGSHTDYPVDGSKFVLNGAREYVPSLAGQTSDITLTYYHGAGEASLTTKPGERPHTSEEYVIRTVASDGSYAPKLFGYPVWAGNAWKIRWWMYNLARQFSYEVTDKVEVGQNSPPFDGANFGAVQHMVYAATLSDVDGRLKALRHVQEIDFVLYRNDPSLTTTWLVGYNADRSPRYGADTYLNLVNMQLGNRKVNISTGLTDYKLWLEKMYYNINPLAFDPMMNGGEEKAPEPTHFIIYISEDKQYRFPISDWNKDLAVDVNITSGETVFVKWVKTDAGATELQLGISGMVAKKR